MDKSLILKSFKNKVNLKEKNKLLNYIKKINNLDKPKFFLSYKKDYR